MMPLHRKLARDKNGVTGFFEDLPALAVVLMVFVIYLSLLGGVMDRSTEHHQTINFNEELNEFITQFRSASCLTHDGITGLFDAHKVMALSLDNLTKEIQVDYDSRIEIRDTSGYYMNYSRTLNTTTIQEEERFSMGKGVGITAVSIWVSDEEIHSARVVITIWK